MSKSRRSFTAEFKREAVLMIQKQGLSVAETARRLDVHENVLRKWQRQLEDQGEQAFPGKGQQSAIEEENRRLREELLRDDCLFLRVMLRGPRDEGEAAIVTVCADAFKWGGVFCSEQICLEQFGLSCARVEKVSLDERLNAARQVRHKIYKNALDQFSLV